MLNHDTLATIFGCLMGAAGAIMSQPEFDPKTRAIAGVAFAVFASLLGAITNKPPPLPPVGPAELKLLNVAAAATGRLP